MSFGKKWKMTRKQLGKQPHSRRWIYHVVGGRRGKIGFHFFRHKKYFKSLEGRISMGLPAAIESRYWC